MKDIHLLICEIVYYGPITNLWGKTPVQYLQEWVSENKRILLFERRQIEEISAVIENNRIQALTSPVSWIREWNREKEIAIYFKFRQPHVYL